MPTPAFGNLRVLCFESRRAAELQALIATFGGRPIAAPALRELPLASNDAALAFAAALERRDYDIVVCLTGAGLRALLEAVAPAYSRQRLAAALASARIAVRGPKPLAVIRELGLAPWATAPEPHTWRELVSAIDARAAEEPIDERRIAVVEYGVSNDELLDALRARGARVTSVSVYRWDLPQDLGPLRAAIQALSLGEVDVVLFTSGVQAAHLFLVAGELGLADLVREGLRRAVVASIGPTTSEELRRHGVPPDLEASRPRSGVLVREAADRAAEIVRHKHG